jgi:predicted porin
MNHRLRLLGSPPPVAAPPRPAQSSVVAYGLLDMSAGSFEPPAAPRVWRAESGGMTTSFFGVRGTEDLGGGLSARSR